VGVLSIAVCVLAAGWAGAFNQLGPVSVVDKLENDTKTSGNDDSVSMASSQTPELLPFANAKAHYATFYDLYRKMKAVRLP
jgi:hypothetical protein